MATSGSWAGNAVNWGYGNCYIFTNWQLASQNIGGNYSTINWQTYFHYAPCDAQLDNGQTQIAGTDVWRNTGRVHNYGGNFTTRDLALASGSLNIGHDGAGNCSFNGYDYVYVYATGASAGWGPGWALTTIPRHPTVTSLNSPTILTAPTNTYQIGISNPGNFPMGLYIYANGSPNTAYRTGVYGNDPIFYFTQAEIDAFYAATPNANSASFVLHLDTTVGSTDHYGTYYLTVVNPTFNAFTYEDTNSTTSALTGNNQRLIKGKSNVRVTISTINKAVANKSATMVKYTLNASGHTGQEAAYSATNSVTMDLNSIQSDTFNIYAVDSRNNSTLKSIAASVFIDYTDIYISPTAYAKRTGGIGSETKLFFEGTLTDVDFGQVVNSVKTHTYRWKKTTDSTWVNGVTTLEPTQVGGAFTQYEIAIQGDLGVTGFDPDYSYDIEITVTDELSTKSYQIVLASAKPQLALPVGSGAAFGAFYEPTQGGDLQILKKNILNIIYPIGAIYISLTDASPSVTLGFGTWVAFAAGQTLVGVNASDADFHEAGHTGGSKAMPSHSHRIPIGQTDDGNWTGWSNGTQYPPSDGPGAYQYEAIRTGIEGTGTSGNLPPYVTVYMWRRTA